MSAKLSDMIKIDHVSDADGAYDGTPTMKDMRDYDGFLAIVVPTTTAPDATHHVTSVNIISNTTAAGGGTDHIIAEAVTTEGGTDDALLNADMGTAAGTTLGDEMIILDVRADQMYAGDRYIGVVTTGTGTLPIHIVYVRYKSGYQIKDMFQATRTAFQYDGDLT